MILEKNIIVSVGDRVIIVEPNPEFYKQRERLLGKEYTIEFIYTNHDKYKEFDNETGDMICLSCPLDKIDTFFLEEEPDFEWTSENIRIPKELF